MITEENIKKACRLAKIKVKNEDIVYFSSQVQMIMKMIYELDNVDCTNVEPLASVNDSFITMHRDEPCVINTAEDLFVNTSGKTASLAKEIRCYVVPKVIE